MAYTDATFCDYLILKNCSFQLTIMKPKDFGTLLYAKAVLT